MRDKRGVYEIKHSTLTEKEFCVATACERKSELLSSIDKENGEPRVCL